MLSDDRHFELVEGCAQEVQQLVQALRFYDQPSVSSKMVCHYVQASAMVFGERSPSGTQTVAIRKCFRNISNTLSEIYPTHFKLEGILPFN